MSDPLSRWKLKILGFVLFLLFLTDILEFLAWKYGQIVARLLAQS